MDLHKLGFKENYYLILPFFCITLWALYFLLRINFRLEQNQCDMKIFYLAGKQILIDPARLYDTEGYFYLPAFALFMAVSFSLIPYNISLWLFYIFNLILGLLLTIEYNKILKLLDIQKKIFRLLFLLITSNGWAVYGNFFGNQSKYFVAFLIFFVIRREIQYTKREKLKDLKFYLINYGLFAFVISMVPYFIYFLLIYIFYKISVKDMFNKDNVKKYTIVIVMLILQNILFLIYPNLIFDFSQGTSYLIDIWYLRKWILSSMAFLIAFAIIGTIILFVITFILILFKNLKIENKFGYISIFIMLFCIYFGEGHLITTLNLALLLFIPFFKEEDKIYDFIKNNIYCLLGLISIIGLNFTSWEIKTYFKYFPLFENTIFEILIHLRWIFWIVIMIISLILLNLKSSKSLKIKPINKI